MDKCDKYECTRHNYFYIPVCGMSSAINECLHKINQVAVTISLTSCRFFKNILYIIIFFVVNYCMRLCTECS